MLGDGKWNSGDQGSYFKFNYGVLKLLDAINTSIGALPGIDYETRTSLYVVNNAGAPTAPGVGYSLGDVLLRYDIINVTTGAISKTVWFNETLQTTLAGVGNPNIADFIPFAPPTSATVIGNLSNDANPPSSNNIGVLPAIANINTPGPWGDGNQALLSVRTSDGALRVALPEGVQSITSSVEVPAGSITIPAGAYSISFVTNGSFTGTINTVARLASTSYNFTAKEGRTLPAIDYEVTAGTMTIDILI